jgi:predicted nucleic acid-binding protein
MTFADTFYYLALLNPGDAAHERAMALTAQGKGTLLTTRWVLTEVGDAMAAPQYRQRFVNLVRAIESDADTTIVPTTDELFHKGVMLFGERPDKTWPLTDCISFVAMREFDVREALTGDHHFEQAGFTALLSRS